MVIKQKLLVGIKVMARNLDREAACIVTEVDMGLRRGVEDSNLNSNL